MLKGVAATSIVLSTALALTGCMTKQGDVGNKNIRSNNYRAQSLNGPRFANDGLNETNRMNGTQQMNNNVTGLHGNSNLELSQDIANKLSALPEIKSAYVALTNNNAYVAVVEDRNNSSSRLGASSYNTNSYRSHSTGNGLQYYHKNQVGNGMGGTGAAGLSGTSTTAAADISDDLKNKVADVVKGMHPTVDNVYVSANADFYSRMQGFATDIASGHPIKGMVNQFNALVGRIFPENAGTGTDGTGTFRGQSSKVAPHYYAPTTPARGNGVGTTH